MQEQELIRDDVLRSYIDEVFSVYDSNKSGTLNPNEITGFFNALFSSLGVNVTLQPAQALEALRSVCPIYNGTINKEQLFDAFKALLILYLRHHIALPTPHKCQEATTTHPTNPITAEEEAGATTTAIWGVTFNRGRHGRVRWPGLPRYVQWAIPQPVPQVILPPTPALSYGTYNVDPTTQTQYPQRLAQTQQKAQP